MIQIIDLQSAKDQTGFEFNLPVQTQIQIPGNIISIPREVKAGRLKVDKLTRFDVALKNFLTLDESQYSGQYISRFKGNMQLAVYIGDDTFFDSKTELNDSDPDADLLSAGMVKLLNVKYSEFSNSNAINVSEAMEKKAIAVDLDTVKSENSITSSEVTLIIFVIAEGNLFMLNLKKMIRAITSFSFIIRGFRFFFNPPSGGSDFSIKDLAPLIVSNWTLRISAADNNWRSVCWSPELGIFVAVAVSGTGNRIMTSPDGINWTIRTSAFDNQWNSVCWSPELGIFVAVAASGTGNRVMTSPNGINWTVRTSAANNSWGSVCWSSELGIFVAVAYSGTGNRVMTSPDGINWTIRTSAFDNQWNSVCWSPELGIFVAVSTDGTGNRVMTSPDGINWTVRTSAANNSWGSVCWSPELGIFVAVAVSGTGNRVMTSPDGINWTIRTSAFDNQWNSVCWSPELGIFVAVSTDGTGNRVMTSPDGINWTVRISAFNNQWMSVCWSPELGIFVAVAYSGTGNRVMTSLMVK